MLSLTTLTLLKNLHFNSLNHNTHVICNAYSAASRNCRKLISLFVSGKLLRLVVVGMAFGLGYDKASDDIKIIRVVSTSFCRSEFFASLKRARVEIYSVNRGCWEDVDHKGELLFWPGRCNCEIIVKGVPYFVGDDVMPDNPVSHQHQILGGFDPCTGLFKKVHYPEHFREESTWVEPFEYQDSLAVMVQFTPGKDNEQMIDMYLLDDDTNNWIKMYSIGPYPYLEYHAPHQSFRTGEIVLEEQLQNILGLYLYNPKTELVIFLIGIDSLKPLWLESYSHTESLVSIEGMELIGNNDKNKKTKPKKKDRIELLSKDFESALYL